jgi:hypothetical protein
MDRLDRMTDTELDSLFDRSLDAQSLAELGLENGQ